MRFLGIALLSLAAAVQAAPPAPQNWLSYGRTPDEQRFSPLDGIDAASVGGLGLAWYADLPANRGQEATPIVADGKLYVSTAWSIVQAYDAKSGALLWTYDPQVPRETGVNACCDAVNRGVALWNGSLFVGTLDGRLVAIDAKTGRQRWTVQTTDRSKPYTITGAPRVIKGKVIIGNGGAEYGVRGYVSAYDAATGKRAWRFYTVPGDPAKPFENPVLAKAAKTWAGQWWKHGGGGTVWDSMAYDPALDLLYIGTGNGSPWNRKLRSDGKGDNLFLSSIVALRPSTGEYVWHYQTTPGDEWDYTATQSIILADLTIDGVARKVLMQAPKNGFFYVLDRESGKLISAKPFIPVNWASGIDPASGRPIENPAARYSETGKPFMQMPGPLGAHSWYPMAFSPRTGLVYLPAQELATPYAAEAKPRFNAKGWNTGVAMGAEPLPRDPKVMAALRAGLKGYLLAWDPVAQKEVWRADHGQPFNGGTLATAGDLVFQGDASGVLHAYGARDGRDLWRFDTQSPIMAAPVAYAVDGVNYIAVLAGYGGVAGTGPGILFNPDGAKRNISRLLVFRLGGTGQLPAAPPPPERVVPTPPAGRFSVADVEAGRLLFARSCGVCHGAEAVSAGVIPDLRYSGMLERQPFLAIVRDGALKGAGMASFADTLSPREMELVRAYLVTRQRETADQAVARP